MSRSTAPIRLALLLGGAAIVAGCSLGAAAPAPTPTPTKTPKPTYTATATPTAAAVAVAPDTPTPTTASNDSQPSPTEAAGPTEAAQPEDTEEPTPEATPTETSTPTPEPTDTPSAPPPPTDTPAPPPPTNTPAPPPTPTPLPFQFTGQVLWDEASANCAAASIRKDSIITDTAGNPVDGVCVCYSIGGYYNSPPSVPSGVPGVYDPGHYDIYPVRPLPEDVRVDVYICDCATGAQNPNSQVVSVDFTASNCGPGQGGHQAAIVNWVKHW
jgi:hypothetical protein